MLLYINPYVHMYCLSMLKRKVLTVCMPSNQQLSCMMLHTFEYYYQQTDQFSTDLHRCLSEDLRTNLG
jgi:hypothetical protein